MLPRLEPSPQLREVPVRTDLVPGGDRHRFRGEKGGEKDRVDRLDVEEIPDGVVAPGMAGRSDGGGRDML